VCNSSVFDQESTQLERTGEISTTQNTLTEAGTGASGRLRAGTLVSQCVNNETTAENKSCADSRVQVQGNRAGCIGLQVAEVALVRPPIDVGNAVQRLRLKYIHRRGEGVSVQETRNPKGLGQPVLEEN
jgi:hypothetical protein